MAINALEWYTQEYSVPRNYAGVTCTAVRQFGEGQKGFFDLPVGDTVTVNMGYRVYEDATKTRARIHRDYTNISFPLLADGFVATGSIMTSVTASMVAALTFSLAF